MSPSNIDDPQFGERQALERTQVAQPRPSQPAAPQLPSPGASAAGPERFESEEDYVSPFAAISDRNTANALFRATVWTNIASHDAADPALFAIAEAAQQDLADLAGEGEEETAPKKEAKPASKEKK